MDFCSKPMVISYRIYILYTMYSLDLLRRVFSDHSRITFLISPKNICCGYPLKVPWSGTSNEYPQHMFFIKKLREQIPELTPNIPPEKSLLILLTYMYWQIPNKTKVHGT